MADTALLIVNTTTTSYYLDECLSFRFEKERYTPYTLLDGKWYMPLEDSNEITSVNFLLNGMMLHFGYPCSAEIVFQDGRKVLNIRSRGYTEALSRNQPLAGLVTDVTLDSLANSAIVCPNVYYEENTPTVNYVNYYDGTSIWEAIICYSIRATGLHPYIRGASTVRVSRPSDPMQVFFTSDKLLQKGSGSNYSNLISSINESDVSGNAGAFSAVNTDAITRGIVRNKDIPFDREWIMDPEAGLIRRLNYSKRGMKYDFFTVTGYLGVDLLDLFVLSDLLFVGEVSRVVVSASQDKPVTTKIYCYHDAYCA